MFIGGRLEASIWRRSGFWPQGGRRLVRGEDEESLGGLQGQMGPRGRVQKKPRREKVGEVNFRAKSSICLRLLAKVQEITGAVVLDQFLVHFLI